MRALAALHALTPPSSLTHYAACARPGPAAFSLAALQGASLLLSTRAAATPPLSDSELEPFLLDLRSFLGVSDDATWSQLLHVQPGQPFRLDLWHRLCLACSDPDTEYFDLLREGVPLGISSPIPACKVMAPPAPPDAADIPLQHCESSWKSAIDHSEIVDELLLEELAQGWIAVVQGGDDELRSEFPVSAVGKLGVVLAEGRPPRLVVDSSVSGVTCHTVLPNRSCNPTLTDVFSSMPLSDSLERLVALVLDVAKAHRRILIRKQDRGLLCFRHKNVLYQCTTLNFGARVSSFYWARAAGLLVRLIHRLLRVRHSAKIYVDDLLCLLDSASAPVWASHVVVLLLLIKVPLSWHKCALSQRVVWIGWEIDLSIFTVRLDPQKFRRLCDLLRLCLASRRCSTHLLERVTGKLLWLSSLFRTFRPSLAPLYRDQHSFLPTMTALDPQRWTDFRSKLSEDLRLLHPVGLAALPPGSHVLRIGQNYVSTLSDLPSVPADSRRIWIQSAAPHTGICVLSEESCLVLRMWPPPAPLAALFSAHLALSVKLSPTHALRPLLRAWAVSSDSQMAPSSFSGTPSPWQNSKVCFRGCLRRFPYRASSHLGSSWLNVPWYTSCTCFWALVTPRCTAFSVATTLPPSPAAGRGSPWLLVYALFCGLSFSYSSVVVFPFTLTTCPAWSMMWRTR